MNEPDFLEMLEKYPVVRTRDSKVAMKCRKRAQDFSPIALPNRTEKPKTDESTQLPIQSEFWSGLSAVLSQYYSKPELDEILAEFDRLHYSSMASLNYEDMQDLATLFDRETSM